MPPQPPPRRHVALSIRPTETRGRGVFADEPIEAGQTIEECPVIIVPEEQLEALEQTPLADYYFVWGGTGDQGAIALGYGSLYNHDPDPNAMYVRKLEARTIFFVALRPIAQGEEITVSYQGGFGDRRPLWFEKR